MTEIPQTRFARLGGDRVAYQVIGDGAIDLVVTPGAFGGLDVVWEEPAAALFFRQIASFSRLVIFEPRGSGSSDPVPLDALPPLESSVEELLAVMDAVGSERAALLGNMDGAPVAMLCAATRPERVSGLILANAAARHVAGDGYPFGLPPEAAEAVAAQIEEAWGTEEMARQSVPSQASDERFIRWMAKWQRTNLQPRAAGVFFRNMFKIDVRATLPSIHVPTLVVHREAYPPVPLEHGRYLAEHIDGARLVVLPGSDGPPFWEHADTTVRAIGDFLASLRAAQPRAARAEPARPERVMATVLFTDIVASTERAREEGDRAWRERIALHDEIAFRDVGASGGRLVKTTGDGIMATFDGPGRAIRCASILRDDLARIGLPIRAGIHSGEIELRETDVGGLAVHLAARVMAAAGAGEVLVSRTVRDLVVGSDLAFADRGSHALRGIEGEWQLFAVVG